MSAPTFPHTLTDEQLTTIAGDILAELAVVDRKTATAKLANELKGVRDRQTDDVIEVIEARLFVLSKGLIAKAETDTDPEMLWGYGVSMAISEIAYLRWGEP